MSCAGYVLDQDGETECECGDEGRVCESCAAEAAAYWLGQYLRTPRSETDPEGYARDMREAGRAHLLPDRDAPICATCGDDHPCSCPRITKEESRYA